MLPGIYDYKETQMTESGKIMKALDDAEGCANIMLGCASMMKKSLEDLTLKADLQSNVEAVCMKMIETGFAALADLHDIRDEQTRHSMDAASFKEKMLKLIALLFGAVTEMNHMLKTLHDLGADCGDERAHKAVLAFSKPVFDSFSILSRSSSEIIETER